MESKNELELIDIKTRTFYILMIVNNYNQC